MASTTRWLIENPGPRQASDASWIGLVTLVETARRGIGPGDRLIGIEVTSASKKLAPGALEHRPEVDA